jgi:hypothetical protein
MFIGLMPFYRVGGAVFAYNVAVLLSFFVAFAGMYRLARELKRSILSATLASLLFTFWGTRWIRIHGHLHILIASSLLPWMAWILERAFCASSRHRAWFALAGVVWALAITNALYSVWVGGIVLLTWIAGRCLSARAAWRTGIKGLITTLLIALVLSAPTLLSFLQAYVTAAVSLYNMQHVDYWGASLNSLPAPFILHPWLSDVAQWIYRGPVDESSVAGLGLVASIVALIGLRRAWREKGWRPVLAAVCLGLLLALGLTLKWDGETVHSHLLRPLNRVIWQLGHRFKPGFFPSSRPFPPFDTAVPLPGLVLAALVPFWEGARTPSRYVLIAGLGFFNLVGLGLECLRSSKARALLAVLLIIEIIPPPTDGVPFATPSHPAFEWLEQESLPEQGILDLYAPEPPALALAIRGETLWATRYHGRPTVSGVSSVWPAHTWFLLRWLESTPHPFQNSDLAPLLRYYQADFVLLHMHGESEWNILEGAQLNSDIRFVRCFDPPPEPSPWSYPICVLEVLPAANANFNVLFREGWSGEEPWGIWADAVESRVRWVATAQMDHRLAWEAFPHYAPGRDQSVSFEVNGAQLMTHEWKDCDPWSGEVIIPASLVEIGWNDVWLHYSHAVRPIDVTDGANPDLRRLSLGFTRLEVEER